MRTDTIRYQFQQPGTFDLPPIDVVWWNAGKSQISRNQLPGITVSVEPIANINHSTEAGVSARMIDWWRFAIRSDSVRLSLVVDRLVMEDFQR